MAQWKIQYMQKEVHILPRSSNLYSIATQCTHREKNQDLPLLPSTLEAQEMYQCTHKKLYLLPEPLEKQVYPYRSTKQTLVQHRQNTSWEPAKVMSQCSSNSYWIMQENGTDQPRVYRRTRTMLKIRCTDGRQTRHNYSQSTESEKAKFQTPSTSNEVRNYVEHNSVENMSQDLVHLTKLDTVLLLSFQNQKKGKKLQKLQMYLHLPLHLHLHLHWRELRNSPTLQDPESQ